MSRDMSRDIVKTSVAALGIVGALAAATPAPTLAQGVHIGPGGRMPIRKPRKSKDEIGRQELTPFVHNVVTNAVIRLPPKFHAVWRKKDNHPGCSHQRSPSMCDYPMRGQS
jgi:hypothetical protein